MSREGPALDRLLHRLAECPPDFLARPTEIDVVALACDHWRAMGVDIPSVERRQLIAFSPDELLTLIAIVLWLIRDDWFLAQPQLADVTWRLLQSEALAKLASLIRAETIINDPDRREEFIRLCLKEMGFRPDGESAAQATDRLTTLDSVERDQVIRKTRKAEARAREVREAMVRKRAEEAAARYSPE